MKLYRPTGLAELKLVRDSGWRLWPPRLPDQPIFYPVTTFAYAERIARDWNAVGQGDGCYGFVTEFDITQAEAAKYPVQLAGGAAFAELWVPAEDLNAFNENIIGLIRLVAVYKDRARGDLNALRAEVEL